MYRALLCEGYVTVGDIDCIYTIGNDVIKLIPVDRNNIGKLYYHLNKQRFLFQYESDTDKNCVAFIDRVNMNMGPSLSMIPVYILKLFNTNPIESIQITGGSVDEIFNPADYYYMKSSAGEKNEIDLIHDFEIADKWTITVENTNVDIVLKYGGVLDRGISSDKMLHPRLAVSFSPTTDFLFLLKVYSSVIRFLQLTQYNSDFGECRVYFRGTEAAFNSGWFFDLTHVGTARGFYNEVRYRFIKPYIKHLLQFAADNRIALSFLPKAIYRWERTDYSPQLVLSLFAAFESEYKANIDFYENDTPVDLKQIKEKTVNKIRECSEYAVTKAEKDFLSLAVDRVNNLGNQAGQIRKIKNAISALRDPLQSSASHLFVRNSLGSEAGFTAKEIDQISKSIVGLRGQVSHENTLIEFDELQTEYIHFLEILVHAQMMKRAGLDDTGIELILGLVFHCNSKYMDDIMAEIEESTNAGEA